MGTENRKEYKDIRPGTLVRIDRDKFTGRRHKEVERHGELWVCTGEDAELFKEKMPGLQIYKALNDGTLYMWYDWEVELADEASLS